MKKRKILIDGDILLYRVVHATTKELVFSDVVAPSLDLDLAGHEVDHEIAVACEHFKGKAEVALSWRGGYFRHDLFPDYKGNRTTPKPMGYWRVREYLQNHYKCHCWARLEADDVLGILSTQPTPKTEERIVVSIDKDMRTIPGLYASGFDSPVERITQSDADRFFMSQVLSGDPTDGFKGCPGIGKVKAGRITDPLEGLPDLWHAVVMAYEKAGLGEADALLTARLAHILQHGEFDKETGRVTLWEPPK